MQAVALVFEHVGVSLSSTAGDTNETPALASPRGSAEEGFQKKGGTVLAQQGAANAALKLLDDLCMMATGTSSIWLLSGFGYFLTEDQTASVGEIPSRSLGEVSGFIRLGTLQAA